MSKPTIQTLEDIAKLANVSKSTVSRALNNSPLISEKTKTRIQAIASEYNFRVNARARNLRLKQSHTIAFTIPEDKADFFASESLFGFEILGGIGSGLRALGYDLLILHVDANDTDWIDAYFNSGRVDGFILNTVHVSDLHISKFVEVRAPFIAWGVPKPDYRYSFVTGDDLTGGKIATEHLLGLGRQRIAFLGGLPYDLSVQYRFKGYEQALQAAGHTVDPRQVVYGDYSYNSGATQMEVLLAQSPTLDAVFASSDLMAIGAIKTLKAAFKRVPEDVAVVGYDDVSVAAYNSLPLTTIRQNIALAGRLLAQNLIQHIETGVVTNVTTPVELVIRESA